MNFFALALTVFTSSIALSQPEHNFKCTGEDIYNRKIEVIYKEYADQNQSAIADVETTINGKKKSYQGLGVYVDGEGGFDYGVTGDDFMFHLVLPPNWVGDNVGAHLYFGASYLKPKASLECKSLKK